MKKVTEKNTKSDILSAYRELIKKYNDLAKSQIPVNKQVDEKEKKEFHEKAQGQDSSSLMEIVNSFVDRAEKLDKGLQKIKASYDILNKAVSDKEDDLEELFGLESGCHSLVALAEARKAESVKHQEKVAQEEKEYESKKLDHEEALKDLDKEYERKEEELKYAVERKIKDQKFDLELLLKKQKVQIEDEMKVLESAKKEFEDEKEAFRVIKDDFEENSKLLIEKEKENSKKALEAVKKAMASDKEISDAKLSADLDKKDFEINLLKDKVDEMQRENSELQASLKSAYDKLQDLAKETVHSKGKDEIIEKLSSIAKKQNSSH